MTPETVDRMLAAYKKCIARREHLKNEIQIMQKQLDLEKSRAMAEDAISSPKFDAMPHGTGTSNPVESLVVRYMPGYVPKYITDQATDIQRLKDELDEMERVIIYVDSWFLALSDKEQFVVRQHIIEGRFWKELLPEYEEKWGIFSKEGLRKVKKRALDKIYEAAE